MKNLPIKFFGYISLKDWENSIIYLIDSDSETIAWLRESFQGCKFQDISSIWEETFSKYLEYEGRKVEDIRNESEFLPAARNSNICTFCIDKLYCNRGVNVFGE